MTGSAGRWVAGLMGTAVARFDQLAARRGLSLGVVFTVSLAASAGVVLRHGFNTPYVHDEFSYLLAADTYAGGRLANPPHPMAGHLETFHVLQRPTYASKYPPGQGLTLALGQVVGHPFWGVALSGALAAAAAAWLLQACAPARWALFGGLLAAGQTGVLTYFGHSYWGGSVFALGGALVAGGVLHQGRGASLAAASAMAVGVVLLILTRPFEGLLYALVPAGVMAVRVVRWAAARDAAAVVVAAGPVAAGLALGLGFTALVNHRVTGDPLVLPYRVYEERYHSFPVFRWGEFRPAPEVANPRMAAWDAREAEKLRGVMGWAAAPLVYLVRLRDWAGFYLGFLWFAFPLVALFWAVPAGDRAARFALGTLALLSATFVITTEARPHYTAAGAGLAILAVVQGLRRVRSWPRFRRRLRLRYLLALAAAAYALRYGELWWSGYDHRGSWADARAAFVDDLEARGGRHLVLVRYGPHQPLHREWVYNRAGIDGAPVVWARSFGEGRDAALRDYFSGRELWVLEAGWEPGGGWSLKPVGEPGRQE